MRFMKSHAQKKALITERKIKNKNYYIFYKTTPKYVLKWNTVNISFDEYVMQ